MDDPEILRSSEFDSQLRHVFLTLIRSEVQTTIMDAHNVAQFCANEKFRTTFKDLVADEHNEVLTINLKLARLQDAIGTLLATDKAVEKIRNSILCQLSP